MQLNVPLSVFRASSLPWFNKKHFICLARTLNWVCAPYETAHLTVAFVKHNVGIIFLCVHTCVLGNQKPLFTCQNEKHKSPLAREQQWAELAAAFWTNRCWPDTRRGKWVQVHLWSYFIFKSQTNKVVVVDHLSKSKCFPKKLNCLSIYIIFNCI